MSLYTKALHELQSFLLKFRENPFKFVTVSFLTFVLGLLGTNNRETFDDMKIPRGSIADSEVEFTNAYEMTSHPKCQISSTEPIRKCKTSLTNSMKCMEIFQNANSKFAPYFNTVNPEVFLEACKEDIASCQTTVSPKYCASANAYVQIVRSKGYPMEHVDECGKY